MKASSRPRGTDAGSCLQGSLTIDVERRQGVSSFDGVHSDVARLLDFLRPVCRATFFVTGEIADKSPDIVQAISDDGHEVGCHGLHHERLDTFTPDEQAKRIALATRHLEKALGKRPLGFRAPEHRANTATLLALEHLGYAYDSSVLPGTPFLRPEPHRKWRFLLAPREPYYPSRSQLTRQGDCAVLELPCSTYFLPFVSKLSMRSTIVSDVLATTLVNRARVRRTPLVYCLHSYDSSSSYGNMTWLRRVIETLNRLEVSLTTMDKLTLAYRRKGS